MASEPKKKERTSPTYSGLKPSSSRASSAARGSSRKRDTRCEVLLRKALWRLGLRYRVAVDRLPGKPDVVMAKHSTVIFVDGDFWHGRDLEARLAKLREGHNAGYWVEKIQKNVERDRRHDEALRAAGWKVLRFWEKDVLRDADGIARTVADLIEGRGE